MLLVWRLGFEWRWIWCSSNGVMGVVVGVGFGGGWLCWGVWCWGVVGCGWGGVGGWFFFCRGAGGAEIYSLGVRDALPIC